MGTEAIAILLSIACYGETATAKTIDLSPQLASEEYWGTHHICVVKIKDIRKDPAGVSKVTYEVQSCLTESNAEPRRTLPASHLWFGNDLEVAPAVSKGETLVIFYKRQGVGGIAAVKLGEPPNESPIMKQLLRLVALRGAAILKEVRESVFDADSTIALYALNRMLALPSVGSDADYFKRLCSLRDRETTGVEVRLAACKVTFKLEGYAANSDEEYAWLRTALSGSQRAEGNQLWPIARRMIQFENRRVETAAFFAQVLLDKTKRRDIRLAVLSQMDNSDLLRFEAPDESIEPIFASVLTALQDPDEAVRGTAGLLIRSICNEIAAHARFEARVWYLERAKGALHAAIKKEMYDLNLERFKEYARFIEEGALPGPVPK